MKILAIETSCDETAIAILECEGTEENARFTVLGNTLLSQVETHREYGGVFPMLAKREHAKNLVPILESTLEEAELLREDTQAIPEEMRIEIAKFLAREPGLAEAFFAFVSECEPPEIDAIAVTTGPGLEPALWVGINFAKALARLWGKPLIAINHMEGHILSALVSRREEQEAVLEIKDTRLPVLALLISGGHTELVLMKKWLTYELIGQTRDDAVGEAYDKVARMLSLPYPGGPEISRLAEQARAAYDQTAGFGSGNTPLGLRLPRPMLHDANCDFSFAGLKTAVLYLLKNNILMDSRPSQDKNISEEDKADIALEFENAVADVLWKKTARALEETGAYTLLIGGGVSANTHIRSTFTEKMQGDYPGVTLRIPPASLTGDNAIMIGIAGFYRALRTDLPPTDPITANGNRSLA